MTSFTPSFPFVHLPLLEVVDVVVGKTSQTKELQDFVQQCVAELPEDLKTGQLSKADGAFVLEGRVNVGAALSFQGVRQYRMAAGSNVHLANPESLDGNQGSRQCTNASPTGVEPVLPP